MYTYIDKAIQSRSELNLLLDDGSRFAGMPSWGMDRSRVKIKAPGMAVWVPLSEIRHVTI